MQTTEIKSLSHDGRGIAVIDGKTTFVDNALPGETVRYELTRKRGKFNEAKTIEVISASPDRIDAKCEYFGQCGGCSLQHMSADAQRTLKQQTLLEQLQHFGGVQPENILPPLIASNWGYRRKARLGVKYVHKKQKLLVGFREKNGRFLTDMDSCQTLDPKIGLQLTTLSDFIRQLDAYQQIPQIEVAITDDITALVVRHLTALSDHDNQLLKQFAQQQDFYIYLQPKGPSTIHLIWPEANSKPLYYHLQQHNISIQFEPSDFVQVNAEINALMINRVIELFDLKADETLLDLFCGLGNFTLPLAKYCSHITGVEGDANLVKRAQANAVHNQLSNTEFHVADLSQDCSQQPWAQQHYDKVLLDPARSGALAIIKLLPTIRPNIIIYVSCNPATLARDSKYLVENGYRLQQAGIMDMFPQTTHVESLAVFIAN